MRALFHTLVAVAWSLSLPPGSAVSLHSRPTAGKPLPLGAVHRLKGGSSPALGSAVSLHSRPTAGEPLPLVLGHELRLKGGSSPFGIAVKIMRMFFDGWMQKQAPLNPIMVFLAFGSWWDLKQDLRRFQNETRAEFKQTRAEFKQTRAYFDSRLDPLVTEKDMRLLIALYSCMYSSGGPCLDAMPVPSDV